MNTFFTVLHNVLVISISSILTVSLIYGFATVIWLLFAHN